MAKRSKVKPKRRPAVRTKYGEPTKGFGVRLPVDVVELLEKIGPNRSAALVMIVRGSVQYGLEYGRRGPRFVE